MANEDFSNIPEEYRPIGMWGYFGYTLLFSIPCVGFIAILILAFGGAKNINLRNFARSYLCWYIIAIIWTVIALLFSLAIGGTAAMSSY